MAQIIRHKKGVLESINGATKRKAELLIATGSSGITSTNSDAIIFVGTSGTEATAANKIIYGTSTPDLTGASYGNQIDGVPYYNTSENKLYLLAKAGNIEIQSTANTGGTGIISGSSQIAELGANIVSSSTQVAADLLSDNRDIDLGTGTFDAGQITSDGTLNVTGISNLGVISGSSMDLTGNANIQGNITLGGNITIGDASTDTIAFGGDVSTDIIPNADGTLDLGSATDKFAEVHATTLFGALNSTNGVISGSSQLDGTTIGSTANSSFIGTFTGTVNANNGVISGSSDTDSITITETDGNISAAVNVAGIKGGVISGSAQVIDDINAAGVISGSGQSLDTATDFGTGRVSGDNFGDADGGSTFTGSFAGDGSGLSGLVSTLTFGNNGVDSDSTVDLQTQELDIVGTSNEVETSVSGQTVTIGLPSDVTIGNDLVVTGDLTVSGTTTTVNSNEVNIGDNIIVLNSDETGTPTQDGGIDIERGTSTNARIAWDESEDYWVAGLVGSESKILRANGDGVISGSAQIASDISGSF